MIYPFTFKVIYWNVVDSENKSECGITFAKSYAEAAENIEKRYSVDLFSIEHLLSLEEDTCIIVNENVIKKIENDEYYNYGD